MDDRQATSSTAAEVAAYVRRHAVAAGYRLDQRGESARLARDSDLTPDAISRLLKGLRVPEPVKLYQLAAAIRRPYFELLVVTGTIPAESLDPSRRTRVASEPITADDLADQWGVSDPADRAYVRETIERLRDLAQSSTPANQDGRAANG